MNIHAPPGHHPVSPETEADAAPPIHPDGAPVPQHPRHDAGSATGLAEDPVPPVPDFLASLEAPAPGPAAVGEQSIFDTDAPAPDFLGSFETAPSQPSEAPPPPPGPADAGFASLLDPAAMAGEGEAADESPVADFPSGFDDGQPVAAAPDAPFADILADFEDALVDGLSDGGATSSGDADLPGMVAALDRAAARPAPPPRDAAPDAVQQPLPAGTQGQAAVLAFASDPYTEEALRKGLWQYEKPSPRYEDPQVWPGGLRAAVAALAGGYSAPLVIVDIDGMPYPAGAIHELAEVCEMGTAVIAIGSDATARSSRELLLAGVSDYLVKPVSAAAVRDTAARAAGSGSGGPGTGRVVGFVGTGGSGTTTLVAATALEASQRGRYVSVLDLNRTVPSSAVLLDVEPAAGLDQYLDVSARATPDPQMLDGIRIQRSERISIYAYRPSADPPPVPSISTVEGLLGELRQRSQLVLVDGLEDAKLRFALLARADLRVVVAEPTGRDAARTARVLDLLGEDAPILLVRNRTRQSKQSPPDGLFRRAGRDIPPDLEIPFDPSLPPLVDRGWPEGRTPRRLRGPFAGLVERILAHAPADAFLAAASPGQG